MKKPTAKHYAQETRPGEWKLSIAKDAVPSPSGKHDPFLHAEDVALSRLMAESGLNMAEMLDALDASEEPEIQVLRSGEPFPSKPKRSRIEALQEEALGPNHFAQRLEAEGLDPLTPYTGDPSKARARRARRETRAVPVDSSTATDAVERFTNRVRSFADTLADLARGILDWRR